MSKELFLQLAFIKAYETQFGTDEFDMAKEVEKKQIKIK